MPPRPSKSVAPFPAIVAVLSVLATGLGAEVPTGTTRHHHPELLRAHTHHPAVSRFPVGVTLSTAWDSRYVSEGRDNLDGDSLLGTTLSLAYQEFTVSAWYADSPDGPYDEFNASLEYAITRGDWDLYAAYTHLRFMHDRAHDHELGAGIAYNGFACGIVPAVDWVYSTESAGAFIELSATRQFQVTPWLCIEPGIVLGFNDGYVADGHDGSNHIIANLSATATLADNVELGGYLSYNWAVDKDVAGHPDDALLGDFCFGGVALTLSF